MTQPETAPVSIDDLAAMQDPPKDVVPAFAQVETAAAGPATVPTPSRATRHLLSRFSYGVTPELVRECRNAGGPDAWFTRQLQPGRIRDGAGHFRGWFPQLDVSPQRAYRNHVDGRYESWRLTADLQRWTMLRQVHSRRQVHESMVEFWSNVLHVPAPEGKSWPFRARYDRVIRTHALGRFDDLLVAAITHPAMGCYLDNARNRRGELNENLGREVLELHTVGLESGFTEAHVRDSARILTGYHVDMFDTWQAAYRPADHARGPVRVLGFRRANAAADGRPVARAYLRYLARHPSTARRLAHRLCVRFVHDDPPARLVERVAAAYLRNDTSIRAALRAMVRSPEFDAAVGAKVRTPVQDLVNTYRVLGMQPQRPRTDDDYANVMVWQADLIGQRPFNWVRPDGFPDVGDAWTSTSRMLVTWQVHWTLAGGWWPSSGVRYRSRAQWLPPLPIRYGQLIDHLSRRILARPASLQFRRSVARFADMSLDHRIRVVDDMPTWKLALTLAAVLNAPAHMRR